MTGSFDAFDRLWAVEQGAIDEMVANLSRTDAATIQARMAARPAPRASTERRGTVAVVDVTGVLSKNTTLWQALGFDGTATSSTAEAVKQAAADPDVSAILLYVDSPGGSVRGTGDLADAVYAARQSKRVVAYISDLGASAAYWIACQADRVYTNPAGAVGSIGTYAVLVDWSQLFSRAGAKVHVVRAGEYKGAGRPGTEVTDKQLADFQRFVDQTNDVFLAAVARGRKMSADRVRQLADGRVHVGRNAVEAGLVDGVRSFDEVLAELQAGQPASVARTPQQAAAPAPTPTASQPQQAAAPLKADPVSLWQARVELYMSQGMDRARAAAMVATRHPEDHRAYLAAVNAQAGRARVAERLSR